MYNLFEMRKFLLSSFVIGSFILYSLAQRVGVEEGAQIVNPSLNQPQPNQPLPTSSSSNPPVTNTKYKDGEYTGDSVDAYYGNLQVKAVISDGKITDVQFLDYPHDRRTSVEINSQATPMLKQEAIQAQSANVDIVSGATATSQAFIQSLQSALVKAQG